VLDLMWEADPAAALTRRLAARTYDAIGVSVRNTDDCSCATRDFLLPPIKELVTQAKSSSPAPVILGGCGFSVLPAATLPCCGADYGIVGDGEAVLPELVRRLRAGESVADLPGLMHRRGAQALLSRARPPHVRGGLRGHQLRRGQPPSRRVADTGSQLRPARGGRGRGGLPAGGHGLHGGPPGGRAGRDPGNRGRHRGPGEETTRDRGRNRLGGAHFTPAPCSRKWQKARAFSPTTPTSGAPSKGTKTSRKRCFTFRRPSGRRTRESRHERTLPDFFQGPR